MSKKKKSPPKCGRVTSVGISRLFNLGNYCNRKIEISAQVGPGESAHDTLANLYWIVERLGPIHKPEACRQLEAATKKPAGEQSEYEKAHLDEWADEASRYHTRVADREMAIKLLDDLGAVTAERDHKSTWDDDTPF